jgi:hypothetical protein
MAARYILMALAIVFVAAAVVRLQHDRGRFTPASKTWALVGIIFALVSIWLWLR